MVVENDEILICLHQWGEDGHPTMTNPNITPGNGLILYFRTNYEFVSQFAFWLKSVRKCGHNAAMKYLGNFKKIVLECIKKGWLLKDPFAGFKTNKKEVIRVALTKDELSSIASKEFETDRLNYVRDIFLFSCYTALSYVDVYQLRRSDIITGVDGGKWIVTTRQKTESATRLPLLPAA